MPVPIPHSQRVRLRRLVASHVQALNAHDLTASTAAFAPHASLVVNGNFSGTPQAIAAAYARLGFSSEQGVFTNLQLTLEGEHFTDEQIVYEGRLRGEHSGTAAGFPPPTRAVLELPCALMYRFEPNEKVIAKHASIDFGPLFRGLYPMPELPTPEALTGGVP